MRDQPAMRMSAQAVIFDLDGVVTSTASVHGAAWQTMFDEFLAKRALERGEPFQAFDPDADYRRYVDGKPRYEGVRDFLAARGIELPFGTSADAADRDTVCGLGNRKNEYFHQRLAAGQVEAFPGTLTLIDRLTALGVRMAVASSSRNARAVLSAAGLTDRFTVIVDGVEADAAGLRGKPDPAVFLEAALLMGVAPGAAVVIEDAVAGIEAGRRGGFGLVIGVDRAGHASALREAGADVVVKDLSELDLETLSLSKRR